MKQSFNLFAVLLAIQAHPAIAQAPPPEPKVKATVFTLPHPGVSEEVMVSTLRGIEAGLKRNDRLEVHDLDTRLADFAQEVPQDQVEAARTALKDGQKALLELDIPTAIQRLQDAASWLAKVLPYIKKQELADAQASLAVAYYENGEKNKGRDMFLALLTWRGDYQYDPQKLPPQFFDAFNDAQKEIEKAKRGSLEIASEPDGAQAYVDGKYVGVTPCTSEGLTVGEHYVTYKKEGYKKTVVAAKVSPKRPLKATSTLERNEKYLLVQQALEKIAPTLGAETPPPEMDDLKQVLLLDHAIFVKASPQPGDKIEVDAWLYDLRVRRKLSRVVKAVPSAQAESQLASLASSLYLNVNYDPELVAPKDKIPDKPKPRPPLYKTWWFYAIAVGAAAVVATVIGLGVVYGRPTVCPENDGCFQVNQ